MPYAPKEVGSNSYQIIGSQYMCPSKAERAAWLANSDRNKFGFTKVPLIALACLGGMITLSAFSASLPPLLFISPIIAIAVPAAFASIACVSLLAAGVYMSVNRNTYVDDRYRLEFDRTAIEPNLYLDEDMVYVQGLITTYSKGTASDSSVVDNTSHQSLFDKNPAPGPQQKSHQNANDSLAAVLVK